MAICSRSWEWVRSAVRWASPALGNISRKGLVALGALVCLGAGISGFALSKSLRLSDVLLVLVGASMMAVFATVNSLVQLITTNEMRGRVMSVYNFAFRGGMPMGNLLSGWLVPLFTAPVVLGVNGLLLVLLALYFVVVQRRMAAAAVDIDVSNHLSRTSAIQPLAPPLASL